MSAICVWDFTVSCEKCTRELLTKQLNDHCKKWVFQKEKGHGTGYLHFQGRMSLKVKKRLNNVIALFDFPIHISPTSNSNRDNDFYCIKDDTRVDGPWSSEDEVIYIPRQIREIDNLYPWQQHIVDHYDDWDTRTINVVFDDMGNIGKSTLVGYMRAHKLAFAVPFLNDYKDVMRIIMDVPTYRCYLFDMPRAIKKDKLKQLYGAIETIKNGYAFDDRHRFRDKVFDCPNIWIFCNELPDEEWLSGDRWQLWEVLDNKLEQLD